MQKTQNRGIRILAVRFSRDRGKNYVNFGSHIGVEDNKQQLHYILIIQWYISYIFLVTICLQIQVACRCVDGWSNSVATTQLPRFMSLSYQDTRRLYLKKESYTRKITKPCKSRSTFTFCLGGFKMWYM